MPSLNLFLLLSYLLSSPLVPLQCGRPETGRPLPLTSLLWLHGKSPKSRRREARRKDGDRESALSSVGHVNCPAWPRPRTPDSGGQENGEEDADVDTEGDGGRDPEENPGGDGHCLGEAAPTTDLGQTLTPNDDRSNELCLSAPSRTGSHASFTNNLLVTRGMTGRTKPHSDRAVRPLPLMQRGSESAPGWAICITPTLVANPEGQAVCPGVSARLEVLAT